MKTYFCAALLAIVAMTTTATQAAPAMRGLQALTDIEFTALAQEAPMNPVEAGAEVLEQVNLLVDPSARVDGDKLEVIVQKMTLNQLGTPDENTAQIAAAVKSVLVKMYPGVQWYDSADKLLTLLQNDQSRRRV